MAEDAPITDELADFIQSGVSILVGTRDDAMRPHAGRAFGARVHDDRRTVTIHFPRATAEATLRDLRANGRIAVTFSRPIDHQGVQLKGTCVGVRESDAEDRAVQERYRAALLEQLYAVGVPRAKAQRWSWWPSFAIDVAVAEVFVQTPGPRAGRRIGA